MPEGPSTSDLEPALRPRGNNRTATSFRRVMPTGARSYPPNRVGGFLFDEAGDLAFGFRPNQAKTGGSIAGIVPSSGFVILCVVGMRRDSAMTASEIVGAASPSLRVDRDRRLHLSPSFDAFVNLLMGHHH